MRVDVVLGPGAQHVGALASLLSGGALVLANDVTLRDACRDAGYVARSLTEQVPVDSPEDFGAYDNAHAAGRKLAAKLAGVRLHGAPTFGAIEAQLIGDLAFFHRIAAALERARREGFTFVVLALTHYNATYAALTDLAAELGYETAPVRIATQTGIGPLTVPLVGDELARSLPATAPRTLRDSTRPAWLTEAQLVSVFYLLTNDADLYLKPVYPVIEEFRAAHAPYLVLTEDSRVIANLASRGVAAVDVRLVRKSAETIGPDHRESRAATTGALLTALERESTAQTEPALRILLGAQRNDAVVRTIDEWLASGDVLDAVLSWTNPRSVFLMPDAMQSSTLVTAIAAAHGIPTVTTVAASVAGTARALGTYRARLVACYGHECVEAFRAIGWEESRIVLTGAPGLDAALRVPRAVDRDTVAAAAGIDLRRALIVVVTSRPSDAEDGWISTLAHAAAARGWQIVLRPHPLHGASAYSEVLRRNAGTPLAVLDAVELRALLHAADVVVTDYSHAGREALAAERPLVAVNVSGSPYPNNRYDEEGVALAARSGEDVVRSVERALTDPDALKEMEAARRLVVDRFNWKNDGQAARRLYELLASPPGVTATTSG